jgi:membrane protease subunit (stomatin/prohibitin family)
MSILSFVSKQFIDILQWTEDGPGVLAWRFPMQDMEIQNGGMLTVRESQRALFIDEGKLADSFGPGLYKLTTETIPILTYLKNWDKGFRSPFKSDVYFFSTREQTDQKWGTPQPITVRDREFGALRIRANGVYSYRVDNIVTFYSKLSGTTATYTAEDAAGQLRAAIMTALATGLGGSDVAFLDMAANQTALSEHLKQAVAPLFASYGLALTNLFLQSLSLPEEVQEHLDRRSSMQIVGDLAKYTQFQAAESLRDAASASGGVAGAGAGLGAGVALGQTMAQALQPAMAPAPAAPTVAAAAAVDPIAMLEKLGDLLKKGILTQAEFDAKKTELLQQIR